MIQLSEKLDHYVSQYGRLDRAGEPSWFHSIREKAFAEFLRAGFPTTRQEDWRFTNVAPLTKIDFRPAAAITPDPAVLESFLIPSGRRIVFVNGIFSEELSTPHRNDGVRVLNIWDAIRQEDPVVYEHLSRYADVSENPFTALNTAFLRDGALIRIPERVEVEEPVQILYVSSSENSDFISFPRNLILAGKESKISILETYVSLQNQRHFTNAVTEVLLEEGSSVEHCKIQQESLSAFHIAAIHARTARESSFSNYSVSVGAVLARNDIQVALDGEGSACLLNGVYLTASEQHVDHHTTIDHRKAHTTSQELYKGILDGKSKAVFNGKIIVRKDAQLTNARQVNKNLLLSQGTQVHTKPELQILADDVKCSHGATVGQLDPEAIFYFKTRGINAEIAEGLLTVGFAVEPTDSISSGVIRQQAQRLIAGKLQKEKP